MRGIYAGVSWTVKAGKYSAETGVYIELEFQYRR